MTSPVKSEWYRFLLAVQFLTRIPVSTQLAYSDERMAASVRHYPLVGVFIGLSAAILILALQYVLPQAIAVVLATGLIIALTGAFHEDGLADTFDGLGGGHTREQALEIMRDSRIGTYGATALGLTLLLKIMTLAALPLLALLLVCIAAHALSRWSSVVVIATSNYLRDHGTGKPTARGVGALELGFASVIAGICLLVIGYGISWAALLGASGGLLITHLGSRWLYEHKLGGYTGDCLGCTQQLSEVGIYVGVLACL